MPEIALNTSSHRSSQASLEGHCHLATKDLQGSFAHPCNAAGDDSDCVPVVTVWLWALGLQETELAISVWLTCQNQGNLFGGPEFYSIKAARKYAGEVVITVTAASKIDRNQLVSWVV